MGVHGLWKLIESAGKPVPVETLDNKVLAVDVSIWLHQLMKGYQNPSGSSVSNAYLLGLFSRVCKLLFTNVKPVFVFDGGVPQLKRKTIAARQQQKNKSAQASEKLREQLLKNLLKQKAIGQVLEEIRGQTSPKKKAPDMFELPPLPEAEDSESEVEVMSNTSSEEDVKPFKMKYNLHTIDVNSVDFKALPADMRHDILTELKETRKQNSWGRIHELPEELGDFSNYQMARLLKRRSVQVSLEEAEKEMGGRTLSVTDVEALLAEGGIEINPQLSKRIASDNVTRYIYATGAGEHPNSSQGEKSVRSANSIGGESSYLLAASVPAIKIKEEIIDSDSDVEFVREVEAIEAMHRQIKEEKVEELPIKIKEEKVEELPIKIKEEKIESVQNDNEEDENIEFGPEDMFDSGSNSEGVIIDDLDLIKDNSGLSQEQILAIIKQQNMDNTRKIDRSFKNYPSSSHEESGTDSNLGISNINPKSTTNESQELSHTSVVGSESKILDSLWFKFYKVENIILPKTKRKNTKVPLNTLSLNKGFVQKAASNKPNRTCLKSVDLSALASNSSGSDSESSLVLPCEVSALVSPNSKNNSTLLSSCKTDSSKNVQNINSSNNGLHKTPEMSSSESDNDLVEVSPTELQPPTDKNVKALHIEINAIKGEIEDDIFADIFSDDKSTNVLSKETSISMDNSSISFERECTTETKDKIGVNDSQKEKEKVANEAFVAGNQIDELAAGTPKLNSLVVENENLINTQSSVETQKDVIVQNTTSNTDETNYAKDEEPHPSTSHGVQQDSEDSEDIDDPVMKPEASNRNVVTAEESPKRTLNTQQLEKLQDILANKERELIFDQNKEDRLATSITEQMYQEAQELLRLFGVPYVVAPMEAEAQCAFMDSAGLTQGTITDDSDIWLFGGRKVYKNFFDQKKFVLEFQANDIQHYFKLGRSHLVLLALLVGSDYTVGLQGVGPVTALEILATFPPPQADSQDCQLLLSSLNTFKHWWQSQPQTFTPLAKKLKNVVLHQGFPSAAVVSAYLQPIVDDSREPFSWGDPDLPGLRDYAERKFGWSRNRTDQILLPVVNRLSKKASQLTLHTFFGAVPNIPAHREQMSRRVQSAVNRLEGGRDDFEPVAPRPRQPRGRGRAAATGSAGRGRGRGRCRSPLDGDDDPWDHESGDKKLEVIPQREKDRLEAAKRKQQAIEILKSKKKKVMKKRKNIRQTKPEANLSESSSDD